MSAVPSPGAAEDLLAVSGANLYYGQSHILWDVDLAVRKGSCTCLMGRNGVGKTTLLKAVMGLLPLRSGQVRFGREELAGRPAHLRARLGIGYVPQGREIFPQLTVLENLQVGLGIRAAGPAQVPERIFELFPILRQFLHRRGGDLSGGQQQQLAIGRALVLDPTLLILDEPNEGIQPNIVREIGDIIIRLNREAGLTVLLVEQKLPFARRLGTDFVVMEKGRAVARGAMDALTDEVVRQYLAV